MNKYVLMLAAAGLIAAAPVYYAFQAHADEAAPVAAEETTAPEAAPAADATAAPAVDAAAPAPAEAPADEAHGEEGHAH